MTIAEALRRFRQEHRLTQKDVADVLGVTPQSYRVYEAEVIPSAAVIKKIAGAFNVSTDYLVGISNVPDKIQPRDVADRQILNAAMLFNSMINAVLNNTNKA